MSLNEYPPSPQLEPQPGRRIFTTLIAKPPMNLDLFGALLFVVSIILSPSGLIVNLIFAALAAYIVYGAVKRAEVHTALKDVTFPEELPATVRYFFAKPKASTVFKQMFRSVFNIIFLVGIVLSVVNMFSVLAMTPIPGRLVVSDALLVVVYILFIISNGYTRAQIMETSGRVPSVFS